MITFKRFHTSSRLSQETTAFDADVLWDGRLIGHARNDGGGGMAIFHRIPEASQADLQAADAFAKAFVFDAGQPDASPCKLLEDYLDHLAGEQAFEDAERASLKRRLKTKTLYVLGTDVYAMKLGYAGNEARIAQHLAKVAPGAVVLNALPAEQAVQVYLAAVRAASAAQRAAQSAAP